MCRNFGILELLELQNFHKILHEENRKEDKEETLQQSLIMNLFHRGKWNEN
ncbi:hypothetical protein J19TS1_42900 [Heyndrickxia oleronia]|nr:hypothetical protein J19TS1_42900 [Heyndrickxia oleronia]